MLITVVGTLALLQADSLIAPGARLEKLGGGYSFTEGPATDANGNIYFTDQPNDRILFWQPGKPIVEWMKPAGRSNGLAFDRKGNLIACADGDNQLWEIGKDKKPVPILKEVGGKLLNGPNDAWVRPDNGIYFTDPLYARPYWTRNPASQQPGQYVYFVSSDRKSVKAVATDLKQPNGIVGTRDGKSLYVADIGDGKTYRYRITADGSLADKTLFCNQGSDGMSLDANGNLYLTGRGVSVYDPKGKAILQIDVPENWTANVTFGGPDRKTLFITASTSVYGLQLTVKGAD